MFSSEIEATDFIDAVLVELIKYCYDVTQEKHPLRYYIPYSVTENHSERMMYSRTLQYIQKYRDKEYEFRKENDGAEFEELKGKPMETMEERKEGLELTPMQFYEATSIHDKQIVKALVEKRVMDVKKVSNKKFVEIMDEYEQWIDSMEEASKNSDEDMVMYSLAFFTIEWKYATELVYGMADHMIKEKIENPELQAYAILCADMTIESILGFRTKTHSRMVKERQKMIASLVVPEDEITLEVNDDAHRYAEMLVMKSLADNELTVNGVQLREWFLKETCLQDWAAFFKEYNIFSLRKKKEFTPEKIRAMRQIYKSILVN